MSSWTCERLGRGRGFISSALPADVRRNRLALEICLDHLVKRSQPLELSTQILLIPWYGMEIDSLDCVPGGVVFNVDSRGHESSQVVVKDMGDQPVKMRAWSGPGGRGNIEVCGPFAIPC